VTALTFVCYLVKRDGTGSRADSPTVAAERSQMTNDPTGVGD